MSLPYFNLYPTDFEAKTSHLTLEEDGAYNRLLRLCWMNPNCSLPDDDAWIMRRMRVDQDTYDRVVLVVLNEFFTRKSGRVSNARMDKEFVKSGDAHSKRVLAGKLGGKAKSLRANTILSSNAIAMPKQPEPEPEPVKREAKASPQKQRASRLSTDWFLPKEWGEWAVSEGCSVDLIRSEADKFRDYWTAKAGASAAKLDWLATWRNWIRAAIERAPSSKQNGKRNDGFDNHGSAQGRGNGVDPALANILRLAGVGQTSGDDCGGTGSAGEEIRPFRLGS